MVSCIVVTTVANLGIVLAIAVSPDFSFKHDSLSDLGTNSSGNKSYGILNASFVIVAVAGISLFIQYCRMYFKLPITSQAPIFGSVFYFLTLLSLLIISSFTGIWGEVHFYSSGLFLLAFTWMLIFFAYSDFKTPGNRNIAIVGVFSLILLWLVFGFTLIKSERSSDVGFAIAESVMIILYTINVDLMCYKAWKFAAAV